MKIHVNRVPAEGLQERASYDPAALDLEREDIRLREPFTVDAVITAVDRELVVRAQLDVPLTLVCGRCLEEFPHRFQAAAVFSYTVRPTDVVDITEDVRQEIMLGYPMVPRCRDTCRGLCPTCGANWNRGACAHAASDATPLPTDPGA